MSKSAKWMTTRLAVGLVSSAAVVMLSTGVRVAGQTPADVAGLWELTGTTDRGPFTSTVRLQQNGSELTGHYASDDVGEAEVKGSVDENGFTFTISLSVSGYDIDVTYTCILRDDGTLAGKMDIGGLGGGTFTGEPG